MDVESYRDYCIQKEGVTESFPFGGDTLVFKVYGKMFALAGIDDFQLINLKNEPETSVKLREEYHGITPGYHMNKTHWNSVNPQSDVPDSVIRKLIDTSYNLVLNSIPKSKRI